MPSLKDLHTQIVENLPQAVADGLIHPNYHHHDPALPDDFVSAITSADAYAEGARVFQRSIPDLVSEASWVVEDGDVTAARWRGTGTFTGEDLLGHKANGLPILMEGMTMYRWENGQVVEGMTLFTGQKFEEQISRTPKA